MPRFLLHLHQDDRVCWDPDGIERQHLVDAIRAAVDGARDVMSGEMIDGKLDLSSFIVITDSDDVELGRVLFRDVVDITGA